MSFFTSLIVDKNCKSQGSTVARSLIGFFFFIRMFKKTNVLVWFFSGLVRFLIKCFGWCLFTCHFHRWKHRLLFFFALNQIRGKFNNSQNLKILFVFVRMFRIQLVNFKNKTFVTLRMCSITQYCVSFFFNEVSSWFIVIY